MSLETEKRLAAARAATLVKESMRVGLGTGSTVSYLLAELGRRPVKALFVATSPATEQAARALGLPVESFDENGSLDLAIDGADQVTEDGWLIKGAGGALTREKIVAASADRFVVIVDSTKLVGSLHAPVPFEILAYGASSTLGRLTPSQLRGGAPSPDGGLIGDYLGDVHEPGLLASRLSTTPGVVEHGLFAPELVSEVYVGVGESVRRIVVKGDHD